MTGRIPGRNRPSPAQEPELLDNRIPDLFAETGCMSQEDVSGLRSEPVASCNRSRRHLSVVDFKRDVAAHFHNAVDPTHHLFEKSLIGSRGKHARKVHYSLGHVHVERVPVQ